MRAALFILYVVVATASGENDESWAWNDDKQKTSKPVGEARYQVYEPDFDGVDGVGFRPHNPGPYGPNSRPFVPSYPGNNGGVLVGPGGPTGIIGRPPRLDGPNGHNGILPPWIREDPRYRELDTCKCRYSFNCPSPGLKFGRCSRDKKYCCFNSRKFPGLLGGHHYPYYPGAPHKHGPTGLAPNYYGNRGPHGNPYDGHPSFGDYYSGPYGGGYGHRNEFESSRPYGYDADPDDYEIYGRSLGKNQTQASEKPRTSEEDEKQ
ncbi:collagen alpha-2(IV) chain-like [Odontomachus brunneus]|uniref:collagen alpha-2(IV) chain-like n=1 Tax=Odontomachus brunneus TaxID=486640 RepID=UPI0013F18E09|nr:collagen alpha-2(IV) chain-like [Odontomachus brunneus]